MFYSEEFYIVYYIELHNILQYIHISVYFKHISKYTKTTFCQFLCILKNVVNKDFFLKYEVYFQKQIIQFFSFIFKNHVFMMLSCFIALVSCIFSNFLT